MGERQVRLRHADRQPVEPEPVELLDLLLGRRQEEDPVRAVDTRRDRLDLLLDRRVERIDEVERVRLLGRGDDGLGERRSSRAAFLEGVVHLRGVGAVLDRERAQPFDFVLGVAREAVDRNDRVQAELANDSEMPRQVRRAVLDRINAPVRFPRVVLERLHRRDEHDRVRPQVAGTADDVEELLHPHVRAEAALRDDVVSELQRHAVRDERVVAVRDVRERAAVDERGLAFERLHEVGLDRLLQEDGHRSGGAQLLRRYGLALECLRDGDRGEPLPQVEEIGRDGDDRHHLRRSRDVEAGLADVAVHPSAESERDVAQRAVVDVDAAAPADGQRIDAELVAVQDVRLEHRGEQVVRRADRVDVAGEVQVHVLHRHHLRIAAARRTALDAEHGPERRLAQAEHRVLADVSEALREGDGRRSLPFARLRRRDRRDVDQLRVRACGETVEDGQVDLRFEPSVEIDLLGQQADVAGQLVDRPQDRALRDLEGGRHRLRRHARPCGWNRAEI